MNGKQIEACWDRSGAGSSKQKQYRCPGYSRGKVTEREHKELEIVIHPYKYV